MLKIFSLAALFALILTSFILNCACKPVLATEIVALNSREGFVLVADKRATHARKGGFDDRARKIRIVNGCLVARMGSTFVMSREVVDQHRCKFFAKLNWVFAKSVVAIDPALSILEPV